MFDTLSDRLQDTFARLREWALETEMGDRDELDPGVDDTAWKQVSMPARECVGAQRCPYGSECFAEASRAPWSPPGRFGLELLVGERRPGHQPKPPTRRDWARVTSRRRHAGQLSW